MFVYGKMRWCISPIRPRVSERYTSGDGEGSVLWSDAFNLELKQRERVGIAWSNPCRAPESCHHKNSLLKWGFGWGKSNWYGHQSMLPPTPTHRLCKLLWWNKCHRPESRLMPFSTCGVLDLGRWERLCIDSPPPVVFPAPSACRDRWYLRPKSCYTRRHGYWFYLGILTSVVLNVFGHLSYS